MPTFHTGADDSSTWGGAVSANTRARSAADAALGHALTLSP
ncbi:MAG: hypothetical protein Q8P18_06115 [Pseudomonadota bacterium]|nr:hypothetical protein [Pseudomonadota bacterium]